SFATTGLRCSRCSSGFWCASGVLSIRNTTVTNAAVSPARVNGCRRHGAMFHTSLLLTSSRGYPGPIFRAAPVTITRSALPVGKSKKPGRVLFRHPVELLLGESPRAQRQDERREPIGRKRIPLLSQVGRENNGLRPDLADRVGVSVHPRRRGRVEHRAAAELDERA